VRTKIVAPKPAFLSKGRTATPAERGRGSLDYNVGYEEGWKEKIEETKLER